MGTDNSKLQRVDDDSIDAYIDRDGGYLVNRHRRSATVTTVDIGLSHEKSFDPVSSRWWKYSWRINPYILWFSIEIHAIVVSIAIIYIYINYICYIYKSCVRLCIDTHTFVADQELCSVLNRLAVLKWASPVNCTTFPDPKPFTFCCKPYW